MTGKRTAQEVILGPLVVHVGKIQNCFPASHPYAKVFLYGFKGGFKDLPGKKKLKKIRTYLEKTKRLSLSEETIRKKSLISEWGKFSQRLKSILCIKII